MVMQWPQLLNQNRLAKPGAASQPERPIFVQDADRITFSAPFRRLANKTQVHPLYEHDHIHHRLIHSVETASVGRSLGMLVGHWLETTKKVNAGEKHTVSGVVQAACLAHDIGNPPFGHAGEAAIGDWFEQKFSSQLGLFGHIDHKLRDEFLEFEGNAQGFRLLTNLEMYRSNGGMQLSYAVLGAFAKYPITAHLKNAVNDDYCGSKKFGIFESEAEIWNDVAQATGIVSTEVNGQRVWRRHPLVFLVEAADDICYNVLDAEDAFTCGDLDFEAVVGLLSGLYPKTNKDLSSFSKEEEISYHRAKAIGSAIDACVEAFKKHYSEIMQGTFSSSLVEKSSLSAEFERIKAAARSRIFKAKRKTELEVSGRNVIWRVLDGVLPIFEELSKREWKEKELPDYHAKLVRALNLDLRGVSDAYTALHCLADFVSGMTDRYAASTAKMVSGVR